MREKERIELDYQKGWAPLFEKNKDKALAYMNEYVGLDGIIKICRISEETKILDMGCGISTVLHWIEGERFGIDPLADEYMKIYKYPEGINIKTAKGEAIPYGSCYFDVVFSTNSIDHVEDIKKVVAEVNRVLKIGGYFVITLETFKSNFKRDEAHPFTLTKWDVFDLLKDKFSFVHFKDFNWRGPKAYIKNKRRSGYGFLVIAKKEF